MITRRTRIQLLVFLVITLTVLAANLFMDLVYGFIDPRARHNA